MDNFTEFNTTQIMNNIKSECVGDYIAVGVGFLLFVSELLPFIQKSKCNEEAEVIDVVNIEGEEERNRPPRKDSLIHTSNGVLHTGYSLYKLFNKK